MEKIYQFLKKKGFLTIILSVLAIGILVHGSRIFTSYYSHDDLALTSPGVSYTSGRWFLQTIYDFEMGIMGSRINAKGFIGIETLMLLSIICCIISDGLKLKKQSSRILLSAIVVTFPYVTTLFSFTFTSTYYCLSLIMALIAALLIDREPFVKYKFCGVLIAIVLLGLSMAIYQTSLCTFIAFSILLKIRETLETKSENWKTFILKCIKYLSICAGGCIFYFISNKIALHIHHVTLSNYQNLDNMMNLSIGKMIHRIIFAYKEFFLPSTGNTYSLYYTRPIRYCYEFILLTLLIFAIITVVKEVKQKNLKKAIQLVLLFLITPIAINSVFLMANVTDTRIYSMMMFSEVMIFVCLIAVIEYIDWEKARYKVIKVIPILLSLLLIYTSSYFGYVANVCYKRAAHQQEQAIGYFNRMITRIQSTEGYKTTIPVVYINEYEKDEESLKYIPNMFDSIYNLVPNNFSSLINIYNWREYMKIWCGYDPRVVSDKEINRFSLLEEVKNMPSYPNDGSIKIIDNTIVIKFA